MNRRRLLLLLGGAFFLVVVALLVLALPFRGVQSDAEAARAELTTAKQALADGKLPEARTAVANARDHVWDAQNGTDGVAGAVWSRVPVAGGAVQDVQHLVSALDDATSIAEIGVELYPAVAGKKATLFRNERIDLSTLTSVLTDLGEAGRHLDEARQSLDQVDGDAPVIGDSVTRARDDALGQIVPLHDTYTSLEPLLGQLPDVLGDTRDQRYLVTMLNPAELRYSGGANLELSALTFREGRSELEQLALSAYPRTSVPIRWPKVTGNRFHRPGPLAFRSATFAPSWPVSGEELLRAWRSASGERADGVIAIDVVALAQLFAITGPLEVPGYGRLTDQNLVQTLVGSYDKYPDPSQQDALNAAIVPAFRERMFEGGQFVEKAQALTRAAGGGHFAVYFRDDEVQEGFAAFGMTGDLAAGADSAPLGVLTQNLNGSKVDIWQRRSVEADVRLAADGSAEVALRVDIHNDTPPYVQPVPDPRTGYFTRWSGSALGIFLPSGAEVSDASIDGTSFDPYVGSYYDRAFLYRNLTLPPGARRTLETTYRVPTAATVGEDGELTYTMTIDPQGLVIPQAVDVTVHLPEGYDAASVPEGWTVTEDGSAQFTSEGLDDSPAWEIVAVP